MSPIIVNPLEIHTMPWFVCFDIAPPTAHGVWERLGMSSTADCADAAVAEIRAAMSAKHGFDVGQPADIFQYQENDSCPA